jgi:hypothetical protein
MSFTDAVYLAAILEAVLFFAAGYTLRASKSRAPAAPAAPYGEIGVDELVRELEREKDARRQHEQTINHLQQMIGELQVR